MCPVIKKIQKIERIKCGQNTNLNVKDLVKQKESVFEVVKRNEEEWTDPKVIVTMQDLDVG